MCCCGLLFGVVFCLFVAMASSRRPSRFWHKWDTEGLDRSVRENVVDELKRNASTHRSTWSNGLYKTDSVYLIHESVACQVWESVQQSVLQFLKEKKMSVSAGTTRIVAMEGNLNSSSFDMDLRDPNNLNNHLQVFWKLNYVLTLILPAQLENNHILNLLLKCHVLLSGSMEWRHWWTWIHKE